MGCQSAYGRPTIDGKSSRAVQFPFHALTAQPAVFPVLHRVAPLSSRLLYFSGLAGPIFAAPSQCSRQTAVACGRCAKGTAAVWASAAGLAAMRREVGW